MRDMDNVESNLAGDLNMRIAYVVPYVPNLIRTRSYNLIHHLSSLGHDVSVFTLGSGKGDLLDAQNLKGPCRDVYYYPQPTWRSLLNSVAALPTTKPLQTVYSWHPVMARQLAERVSQNDFDVIHVEHLRGSRFGLFLKSRTPNMPVVWDAVDCISHLFQQASKQSSSFFGKFISRFELSRTKSAEGDLVCRFDRVLVTAPSDRNALLELVPSGN